MTSCNGWVTVVIVLPSKEGRRRRCDVCWAVVESGVMLVQGLEFVVVVVDVDDEIAI